MRRLMSTWKEDDLEVLDLLKNNFGWPNGSRASSIAGDHTPIFRGLHELPRLPSHLSIESFR